MEIIYYAPFVINCELYKKNDMGYIIVRMFVKKKSIKLERDYY